MDDSGAPEPRDRPPRPERISVAIGLKHPIDGAALRHAPAAVAQALRFLESKGFEVVAVGRQSIVVTGTEEQFLDVFHSKLTRRPVPPGWNYSSPFEYIAANPAEWREYQALAGLVESISVERPHIYLGPVDPCLALPPRAPRPWAGLGAPFAAVSGQAPALPGFTGLQVLTDVPRLLRADKVHADGIRGTGVRVVMIDSGFAHGHPFFVANGFRSRVCLSPLLDAQANSFDLDRRGHGTGESANLFAVAPGVELTGIKLTPDAAGNDSALLAPFHHAVASRPHVISLSIAFDLCDRAQHVPETTLREALLSLENEIRLAVAAGIVVVAGAGNGQFGFPAQMPEVIAAGGVFADDPRLANPPGEGPPALRASNFASAFKSRIVRYNSRKVPDCCGLVGEQPDAAYILLPLPPGSEQDRDGSLAAGLVRGIDGTAADDGWAVFSGTSAAAPQVAGVCALMLEANPSLTPADVKRILCATAQGVTDGFARSMGLIPNEPALAGADATGAGLVDAFAAVAMAKAEAAPRPGGNR